MRKKALFISLALALVLTTLMPATTLAAKPVMQDFNATGTIDAITPGKVIEAGTTGKWVVVERELTGSLSGDISGTFNMNYHAMVESIYTQAGDLQGWLTVDDGSRVRVKGTIEPLDLYWGDKYPFITWYDLPGFGLVRLYYVPDIGVVPLFYLEINGQWTIVDGAQGNGDFTAYAIFIPTPEGHVYAIVDSAFVMTGKWKP